MNYKIPVQKPVLPTADEIYPFLTRLDQKRIYTNFGPLASEFEAKCAEHFGVEPEHVVATANATLALEGSLATNPTKSNKWKLPSWTFTATASSLLRSGFTGHFEDVNDDWRVKQESICEGLLEVLPFGTGLRQKQIPSDCTIIDGAASFDALANINFPSHDAYGLVVSFHATKILPSGEGGIFISKNSDWVKNVKKWINFGMQGSRESQITGSNGKLSEYHAAVGLASIQNWATNREKWKAQNSRAKKMTLDFGFKPHEAMLLDLATPYWIIDFRSEKIRNSFQEMATKNGIETRLWWGLGAHKMNAYRQIAVPTDGLNNTESLSKSTLGLPMFLDMEEKDWMKLEKLFELFDSSWK